MTTTTTDARAEGFEKLEGTVDAMELANQALQDATGDLLEAMRDVRLAGRAEQNPDYEHCRCRLVSRAGDDDDDARQLHDAMLGLNGSAPLASAAELAIAAIELSQDDWNVLTQALTEHRWNDPVGVAALMRGLDQLAGYVGDVDWLRRVGRGEVTPDQRMQHGVCRMLLEDLQGKCPWVRRLGSSVAAPE